MGKKGKKENGLGKKRERQLQMLLDRQAILDCVQRYARGLDRHDDELTASAYHGDALDHHGGFTGTPAQFEQKRDDGGISRGHAGTIDYQTESGTVSLSDDAWLTTDGKNQISAKTLVYNIRTQSFQGRPKTNTPEPSGTGRIRIVIPAREKPEEKKP